MCHLPKKLVCNPLAADIREKGQIAGSGAALSTTVWLCEYRPVRIEARLGEHSAVSHRHWEIRPSGRKAVQVRCLQPGHLASEAHEVVAMVIREYGDNIFGRLSARPQGQFIRFCGTQ